MLFGLFYCTDKCLQVRDSACVCVIRSHVSLISPTSPPSLPPFLPPQLHDVASFVSALGLNDAYAAHAREVRAASLQASRLPAYTCISRMCHSAFP